MVNQHFSTLYNPTKTTIKTQLQKQRTRYCYRDNKQEIAAETLQRQLTRYCYRENKKTTNKILLQLHYRDNTKYTATETLQRKQTRHYYRDTTETTNKIQLQRHVLQRQQTIYSYRDNIETTNKILNSTSHHSNALSLSFVIHVHSLFIFFVHTVISVSLLRCEWAVQLVPPNHPHWLLGFHTHAQSQVTPSQSLVFRLGSSS